MSTVTQVQDTKNAEGQPIKLAVAYDDEVHNQVRKPPLLLYMDRINCLASLVVQVRGLLAGVRYHHQISAYRGV